ncbi:MAG TPA: lysylphosphatidylglycerol synthase transmembrane domain-containing protein [Solirubrobacteraceae bacterium]|nr:lysylphosphatidylglycerol synthase transmembrane domain-containing protein [Solirubrobacteraceae bacterium]
MEESKLSEARGETGRGRAVLRWLGGLAVAAVSVVVLLHVASPAQVLHALANMSPGWLVAAVAFELASCFSYPIVFRRFFPEPPRPVGRQVAWIAMGAGAVLPGGNFSSAAATGWLLRHHGIGARPLAERCGALLCFLTLFGFFVNGVAAACLLVGLGSGPHDLEHAGVPILVSLFVLGAASTALVVGRRYDRRARKLVGSLTTSLESAWRSVTAPHWRMLGAVGFLLFDLAALWAACRATGHPVGVLAVAVAYFIGYLATMIPMPAGLGVLDSGLAGALVLYGFSPAASVGAVLVYHAISLWVPGLGGLIAWLPTRYRRPLGKLDLAVHPAQPSPAKIVLADGQP